MKMSKTLFLGGLLLTGTLGMSSGAVAAENAAGVKEFMGKTVETAKQAQAAAAAGDKDGCLSAIKQTKQNYKEITGDAAGREPNMLINHDNLRQVPYESDFGRRRKYEGRDAGWNGRWFFKAYPDRLSKTLRANRASGLSR